jgi:hypothetical protein
MNGEPLGLNQCVQPRRQHNQGYFVPNLSARPTRRRVSDTLWLIPRGSLSSMNPGGARRTINPGILAVLRFQLGLAVCNVNLHLRRLRDGA